MILRFIIWSIVLTLILRFVIRFILPIFQVTSMAQKKMAQMQQQMHDMEQKQKSGPLPKKPTQVDGDYIEYEEVK